MKKLVLFFICAFSIVGCNDGGGGSGGSSAKSLWSIWTTSDLSTTLDLRNGKFNIPNPFVLTLNTGHQCSFNMNFNGTLTSGDYSITDSTYVIGTGDGNPINCAAMNELGTYSIQGSTLKACPASNPQDCETYN